MMVDAPRDRPPSPYGSDGDADSDGRQRLNEKADLLAGRNPDRNSSGDASEGGDDRDRLNKKADLLATLSSSDPDAEEAYAVRSNEQETAVERAPGERRKEARDFYLTDEQIESRFDEKVRDYVFADSERSDRPHIVLLGGQPAAGKSNAEREIVDAFRRDRGERISTITGDAFRPLHPRYQEVLEADEFLMPNATQQAAGRWVKMSLDHALESGKNVILEGTFRDPDVTARTARDARDAGFTVEVVAIATPAEKSRLSAVQRYFDEKVTTGAGRWTPNTAHDAGYAGTPATVAALEGDLNVQKIGVWSREGLLCENVRGADGKWVSSTSAVEALEAERSRRFTPAEIEDWIIRHDRLVEIYNALDSPPQVVVSAFEQLARDRETVMAMSENPMRPDHG